MLFEADYAKNYASILYQCLAEGLISASGAKHNIAKFRRIKHSVRVGQNAYFLAKFEQKKKAA